jgi:hypothetical protein
MIDGLNITVKQHVSSLIEAEAVTPDFRHVFVTIDAETGETVSTNVPVGSWIWRRLAKAARRHK